VRGEGDLLTALSGHYGQKPLSDDFVTTGSEATDRPISAAGSLVETRTHPDLTTGMAHTERRSERKYENNSERTVRLDH
jgi:hypothetical protein